MSFYPISVWLQDVIQIHLQALRGSIMVLTCEVGSGETTTSAIAEKSRSFQSPEESRIKTSTLHKGKTQIWQKIFKDSATYLRKLQKKAIKGTDQLKFSTVLW